LTPADAPITATLMIQPQFIRMIALAIKTSLHSDRALFWRSSTLPTP
jgi:type IV secretory pathway VirB3-like protein